jgi:Regulator of cell morphogenesis and NO signaling
MTEVILSRACGPYDGYEAKESSMQTQPNTIAELAIAMPRAIETLEKLGIDYCCNGRQSIAEACHRADITVEELLTLIPAKEKPGRRDWAAESLVLLSQFIVRTHHQYTRDTLPTLRRLAMKVREKHGVRHPELAEVERLVFQLSADLIPHLSKEEEMLFPYIAALEEAAAIGREPHRPRLERPVTPSA